MSTMWKLTPTEPYNEPYVWTKNVFSETEIGLIIDIGKSLPIINGTVVNDTSELKITSRKSNISWIKPTPATEFIFRKIEIAINKMNSAFYRYDLTEIEDLQFSEYDESYQGMYTSHTDDGADAYSRKISFSIQLSDATDYDGGDLLIYRHKIDKPSTVQRDLGFMAIFPSWSIHEVTPVTRGTRYSLVGWVHGPRFR